jgi:arylsulfatase A-like enzyme
MNQRTNVVFVFSDQHRADATGYAGDPNVKTPVMDRLAGESINFTTAVTCAPVCSPYRGSLLTGQYPLTHGVFLNDVCLGHASPSLADAFRQAGYQTTYIGKWHLDGHGRSSYIPPERRQGFQTWQVLECTHDYNRSYYYHGDDPTPRLWEGYDAEAQTRSAQELIRRRDQNKPFLLVLSWGPPHNPYETAPQRFKDLYDPETLVLRPNVQLDRSMKPFRQHTLDPRLEIAGYYAHISALDACLGCLLETLEEEKLAEDTIFVYTSDHGDMLWSHGEWRKQWPMDESIRVPFLLRCPSIFGREGRQVDLPINTPDIMPTLLGLCNISIPGTVEGMNYAPYLRGEEAFDAEAALIEIIHPFSEYQKAWGGREYRGLRTRRYTYVRDLHGPWLLFDNQEDPYQLYNRCSHEGYGKIQQHLDELLSKMLQERGDQFLPGEEYVRRWGYTVDETGAVPFEDTLYWSKEPRIKTDEH